MWPAVTSEGCELDAAGRKSWKENEEEEEEKKNSTSPHRKSMCWVWRNWKSIRKEARLQLEAAGGGMGQVSKTRLQTFKWSALVTRNLLTALIPKTPALHTAGWNVQTHKHTQLCTFFFTFFWGRDPWPLKPWPWSSNVTVKMELQSTQQRLLFLQQLFFKATSRRNQ